MLKSGERQECSETGQDLEHIEGRGDRGRCQCLTSRFSQDANIGDCSHQVSVVQKMCVHMQEGCNHNNPDEMPKSSDFAAQSPPPPRAPHLSQ